MFTFIKDEKHDRDGNVLVSKNQIVIECWLLSIDRILYNSFESVLASLTTCPFNNHLNFLFS